MVSGKTLFAMMTLLLILSSTMAYAEGDSITLDENYMKTKTNTISNMFSNMQFVISRETSIPSRFSGMTFDKLIGNGIFGSESGTIDSSKVYGVDCTAPSCKVIIYRDDWAVLRTYFMDKGDRLTRHYLTTDGLNFDKTYVYELYLGSVTTTSTTTSQQVLQQAPAPKCTAGIVVDWGVCDSTGGQYQQYKQADCSIISIRRSCAYNQAMIKTCADVTCYSPSKCIPDLKGAYCEQIVSPTVQEQPKAPIALNPTETTSSFTYPILKIVNKEIAVYGPYIEAKVWVKNTGESMSSPGIFEIQFTRGQLYSSVGTMTDVCDPEHPENVHAIFQIDSGDTVQVTIKSPVMDAGGWSVIAVPVTKCSPGNDIYSGDFGWGKNIGSATINSADVVSFVEKNPSALVTSSSGTGVPIPKHDVEEGSGEGESKVVCSGGVGEGCAPVKDETTVMDNKTIFVILGVVILLFVSSKKK